MCLVDISNFADTTSSLDTSELSFRVSDASSVSSRLYGDGEFLVCRIGSLADYSDSLPSSVDSPDVQVTPIASSSDVHLGDLRGASISATPDASDAFS